MYERLAPGVDLVLFDLKIVDRTDHHEATGVYSDRILANAAALAERGVPIWVRTPIVPGYTATEENIGAIAHFIKERMPTVERWDLLPYTNLGRPKYHRLALAYDLEATEPPTGSQMGVWRISPKAAACGSLVPVTVGDRGDGCSISGKARPGDDDGSVWVAHPKVPCDPR